MSRPQSLLVLWRSKPGLTVPDIGADCSALRTPQVMYCGSPVSPATSLAAGHPRSQLGLPSCTALCGSHRLRCCYAKAHVWRLIVTFSRRRTQICSRARLWIVSLSPFLGAGNPRRLAPLRRVHLTSTRLSSIQSAYTSVEPLSVSLLYHRRGVWYTNPLVALNGSR